MLNIVLVQMPGGLSRETCNRGTTVAQFVAAHSLTGRDISIGGTNVPKNQWNNHVLQNNDRLTATQSVKGA